MGDLNYITFKSLSSSTLICPLYLNKDNIDYRTISTFVDTADNDLIEELFILAFENITWNDRIIWLNTEGKAVNYLHLRLDFEPKYYTDGELDLLS